MQNKRYSLSITGYIINNTNDQDYRRVINTPVWKAIGKTIVNELNESPNQAETIFETYKKWLIPTKTK